MEKKIIRAMFTGDSVTDCGRLRPVGDGAGTLGDSYLANIFVQTWTNNPQNNVRFFNSATSGDTTRKLVARFDEEVLAYAPDYVFIMIGINDCWRFFDDSIIKPEHQIPAEESEKNMEEMIKKTIAAGAVPVMISPLFFDTNKNDPMRMKRDDLERRFLAIAKKYGVDYIDVQPAADEFITMASSYMLAQDRVHPKAIGKQLIANVIMAHPAFRKMLEK